MRIRIHIFYKVFATVLCFMMLPFVLISWISAYKVRLQNFDYWQWARNGGEFQAEYHELLVQDPLGQTIARGRSPDEVRRWFPLLKSTAELDPHGYGAEYARGAAPEYRKRPLDVIEVFAVSGRDGWGFYMIFRNGKSLQLRLIKG